jgi:hypothetical protein
MSITINVRMRSGAHHARAMRLGVTASSAEGAHVAARAVCRKLGVSPSNLEQRKTSPELVVFTHPGSPGEDAPT